ncbi:hypothetical protein GDO86_000239 [Hymenochirus boettgeri]|uniref:Uncharacterized protein n=1 Tax=Hymenochirus boettgeri TaxID=247094 RepID=A0A8T2KFX4_9PIPI|nr:hypothetical protein GDO86_000239 [Hymenochirus boettgeri]
MKDYKIYYFVLQGVLIKHNYITQYDFKQKKIIPVIDHQNIFLAAHDRNIQINWYFEALAYRFDLIINYRYYNVYPCFGFTQNSTSDL